MSDFNYIPSYPMRVSHEPRVFEARFGDGYSQSTPQGINSDPRTWELSFTNRSDTEATAIIDFLRSKKGAVAFTWTPPGGAEVKVLCRTYEREVVDYNINNVTATFTEEFGR